MITYYKLFSLLHQKGLKISDLRKILSSGTVAKLSKNEPINGESINKICLFLNCQPSEIMEVVEDQLEQEQEPLEIYKIEKEKPITKVATFYNLEYAKDFVNYEATLLKKENFAIYENGKKFIIKGD